MRNSQVSRAKKVRASGRKHAFLALTGRKECQKHAFDFYITDYSAKTRRARK
jgi:hypothetical protein